jgi:glycosyltransferase involved in cell wall biosynthesis
MHLANVMHATAPCNRLCVQSGARRSPDVVGSARVIHFQRNPFDDQFSIELLFASLRSSMRGLGVDVTPVVVPYQSKGFWPRAADVAWVRRHQGDVNHITGDVHFLALGLRPERTILTIHDCWALERLGGVKHWMMRKFWFDLPIRHVRYVTVISYETKRQLLRYVDVPEEKIVVIPDAVAPIFQPYAKPFCADCPQILHIGTKANKNLPRLIEALRGIRCHLKVVGILDNEQRRLLETSGLSYDVDANVGEAGMYRAYCDADVVSFASLYEGFGMPIVEAQWVERPVVTSHCSSMPEIAGDGACLVDPFDVKSIREGLERVIGDEAYRESIVERGRKNREQFALEEVARRYIELYERVLAA